MFTSITDDIRQSFRSGNMITRLILINFIVFVFVVLLRVFTFDWQASALGSFYALLVHDNLALSSSFKEVAFHPWSLLTHMFLHEGVWHVALNMIWLYWMGRILGDLLGDRKVLPIYILGGLFGALVYLVFAALLPSAVGPYAMGASASVCAITLAAATTSPNYGMRLLILGDVKLKYIALAVIVIDLLYSTISNSGGHFAHLGGAFFGWLSVYSVRNGFSVTESFERLIDREPKKPLFTKQRPKPKMTVAHKSSLISKKNKKPISKETDVDKILDKINSFGIDSLSLEEKEILDKASKK